MVTLTFDLPRKRTGRGPSASLMRCVSALQCDKHYVPVCGSNGDTYQNECYRLQAACKQQRLISRVSDGPCAIGGSD